MKKFLAAILASFITALIIPCSVALASDDGYIIPETAYMDVTYEEFESWDYESLGYIMNEIFARHGFVFSPGGKYYNWFNTKSWYIPNANRNNAEACYSHLTDVEWRNQARVKEVRKAKAERGDYFSGRSIFRDSSWGSKTFRTVSVYSPLQGFTDFLFKSNQRFEVYSGPSYWYWRGANGKAVVSTNDAVWCMGYEGNWLLLTYETNQGSYRVGYTDITKIVGSIPDLPTLEFEYTDAVIRQNCTLTDDPVKTATAMGQLRVGDAVTYLTQFFVGRAWAYVETTIDGQTCRGFVPVDAVAHTTTDNEDELGAGYGEQYIGGADSATAGIQEETAQVTESGNGSAFFAAYGEQNSENVRQLQIFLQGTGDYTNAIDGNFAAGTRRAWVALLERNQLSPAMNGDQLVITWDEWNEISGDPYIVRK